MTPRAISGLLSSLLVLAGVFFFINAACSSASPDIDTVPSCGIQPITPGGATITLVEPRDGAVIAAGASDTFVTVPVRISTTRVAPNEPRCKAGNGHFQITATRSSTDRCPAGQQQLLQVLFMDEGTVSLVPGGYTLRVTFVDGQARPYVPELTATAHVIVTGPTGAAGSSACPP
jgi:hypothetical protein